MMKRVVSISLGSSKRNHQAIETIAGQTFCIERIGTDGNKLKAIEIIKEMDGKVDAFGLGGTDLYIYAGNKRYTFRESVQIASAAQYTPIVDGSGLKNTLERRVVKHLELNQGIQFKNRSVLVVCAVDRFGLAEALVEADSNIVFGDLMFGLGIDFPIRSLSGLARLARIIAPVVTKLPISWFYPTGKQQTMIKPRFTEYFEAADIIAGDFHFIRRNMPYRLTDKIIITNTVTKEDQELLRERGVATLVTSTPDMGGRSFGTNTIEAILVAVSGKKPEQLTAQDYGILLDQIGIEPRITNLAR
ncbi:quinate 5-dehydrogenase [Dendrosporobacter sp. 1207_IL3150]|uniref:quinate 5-dehydrogenase n=1 Tax=Dendrosporobacter sp. 1207_IL3150 TaxID=3084054 RepID=UPI002FD886B8